MITPPNERSPGRPKGKAIKRNLNPSFDVLTVYLEGSLIQKMDQYVLEGFAITRCDFIKNAIVFYYRQIFNRLFKAEIGKIGKTVLAHPKYTQHLNLKNKLNKLSLDLGTPKKVVNGKIYEFRLPTTRYIKPGPRWCYIGDENDTTFEI